MKNKYIIMCLLGLFIPSLQAQIVSVASGSGFNIKAGTIIGAGGLELTPSSDFNLTSSLSQSSSGSTTAPITSINKSYQFETSTPRYRGTIQLNYQNTELNGVAENGLKLLYHNGNRWALESGSSNNAAENSVSATVTGKKLNEISLANNTTNTASTQIEEVQCGTTLTSLTTVIAPIAVPLAQGYQYKVTNITTNQVNYYTRSKTASFALSQRADAGSSMSITFSTTYAIAVAVKINGVFSAFGSSCSVQTPALPTPKIHDDLCGTTLENTDSYLYLNEKVAEQNDYRYKVTQGAQETVYERIGATYFSHPFQLKELPEGVKYDTPYTIAVSVFYNGAWQNYGTSCIVSTPAAPQSKLATSQCGINLNKDNSNELVAQIVRVAQAYRFTVSKGASTYTVETANGAQRSFRMTEVPGLTLESATTYTIQVAIKANDTWQPYGESCTVTTN